MTVDPNSIFSSNPQIRRIFIIKTYILSTYTFPQKQHEYIQNRDILKLAIKSKKSVTNHHLRKYKH